MLLRAVGANSASHHFGVPGLQLYQDPRRTFGDESHVSDLGCLVEAMRPWPRSPHFILYLVLGYARDGLCAPKLESASCFRGLEARVLPSMGLKPSATCEVTPRVALYACHSETPANARRIALANLVFGALLDVSRAVKLTSYVAKKKSGGEIVHPHPASPILKISP